MPLNTAAHNPNTYKVLPSGSVTGTRGSCSYFERPKSGNRVGDKLVIVDLDFVSLTWNGMDWATPHALALSHSGVPIGIPPSGSVANNGVVSGWVATLPFTLAQPAYLFYPAGALYAGSPAGLYYTLINAGGAGGTVYADKYTSGVPAIPAKPTPITATGPGAYTQSLANITLWQDTLPGGILGLNGEFLYSNVLSANVSAGARLTQLLFGGAVISTGVLLAAANTSAIWSQRVRNMGVQNRQITHHPATPPASGTPNANQVCLVDLSVNQTISFTGALSVATDFVILSGSTLQIIQG